MDSMSGPHKPPTILVMIGVTGDLSKRKLLPAIERLAAAGELPEQFHIIGITRRNISRQNVIDALPAHLSQGYPYIDKHLDILQMDLLKLDEYQKLAAQLQAAEKRLGAQAQRLFYLSVPPQASQPVIELLGQAGLNKGPGVKLLIEKPFGSDLASAQDLFKHIARYFDTSQVYLIDHYLAKEMAQNVLFFREGNSLFKNTWNKDFIESIEIMAAEQIGIEGRVTFYEQTGALRDVLQSHLLQLTALTLMDLPSEERHVQQQRLAAIEALQPPELKTLTRGQYNGYGQEVQNPKSKTETFVSLTLSSSAKQWQGVPITLTTGKGLNSKHTEIRLRYRKDSAREVNELCLCFEPREGIEMLLWSKQPGYESGLERMVLHANYGTDDDALAEAHEQVIYDAIRSNHTLFTSPEEVLAAWRLLAPVQAAWAKHSDDVIRYDRGSTPEGILSQKP
jgi:glucose-6-phosphate 1-dehydrogenase